MKNFLLILIMITFGCRTSNKHKPVETLIDSLLPSGGKRPAVDFTGDDRLLIIPEEGDTLYYTQQELDAVKEHVLGKNQDYVVVPDESFPANETINYADSSGEDNKIRFSGEVGIDNYYELYAYFLKSKNGEGKVQRRRKTTIEVFRNLNELFSRLYMGGTYYGHQYRRILGFAEYSIYRYLHSKEYYTKNYSVVPQKKIFIQLLRQTIIDEVENNNDNGLTRNDKLELQNDLFKIAKELDKLIADYFYLKSAQEFMHSHYP